VRALTVWRMKHTVVSRVQAAKEWQQQLRLPSLLFSKLTRLSFLRRQPRNFENVTLVARRSVHFRGVLAIFLVDQLPSKTGVLVHKNSLASYQQCSHSVEPRALTCPFKQNYLSAWSYPNL